MELFTNIINEANYVLWTYILIIMLLGCAIWFSVKTRFVQFRMLGEMIRLLGDSTAKINGHEKHISSFQAFTISLASRVGTGNLAGVATALTVGGPGAIFWMWIIALLGSSSAFVESTLAQLFKVKGKHSYVGGPAYYMERGLKKRWMGVLFAVLITVTFGLAFNSVQSNTMSAALQSAFSIEPLNSGIVISVLTLVIILEVYIVLLPSVVSLFLSWLSVILHWLCLLYWLILTVFQQLLNKLSVMLLAGIRPLVAE